MQTAPSNVEIPRSLLTFTEAGQGPDAFTGALFAPPVLGPRLASSLTNGLRR